MNKRNANLVSWYTPKRARVQKISGVICVLVVLVLMLLTKSTDFFATLILALWLYTIGEYGSAIAELKEKAGIQEVTPFFNKRSMVIEIICIIFIILACIFSIRHILQ